MLTMIADMLLVAGALGAGLYCFVLSRRLRKFNDLEQGVGGAVAVLSSQVDDLTQTLKSAQTAAVHSTDSLSELTERAEGVSRRLEMMMASMHDLPDVTAPSQSSAPDVQPPASKAEHAPAEQVQEEVQQDAVLFASRRKGAGEAA